MCMVGNGRQRELMRRMYDTRRDADRMISITIVITIETIMVRHECHQESMVEQSLGGKKQRSFHMQTP